MSNLFLREMHEQALSTARTFHTPHSLLIFDRTIPYIDHVTNFWEGA